MNRVISWFVHNPVASNLLMLLLVVGGLSALPTIHLEEFPTVETDVISVSVQYRGAAPEESEQSVCVRIEEAVDGAPGIDRITSVATEGSCRVLVELLSEADDAAVLDEVKNRVDGISTFPVETEKPIVSLLVITNGVLQIALYGDLDERTLRELGQQVRDEIADLPGISQVELNFIRDYEISIEVSEETLRRHDLRFEQIAHAIRAWSLDLPGGSVKATGGEVLIRTKGQAYRGEEFADVVVLTRTDGTTLTLGEIATIRDAFEDVDLAARFDGKPAVLVDVSRYGEEDIIAIADSVFRYLDELRARLPSSVSIQTFNIESDALRERLSVVTGNAIGGLLLVLVVLGLFLRFRVALWVAAGVPISLFGALMVFPFYALSISSLSVLAFLLVIGILVDDAIVIGESVYTHEQAGESQFDAAVSGTLAVYVPVTFGVATTVAAFLPLVLVPGRMGRMFLVIGLTAILCLVFSLIESQLVLPGHLAHRRSDDNTGVPPLHGIRAWQRRLSNGLQSFGANQFGDFLKRALEWRYVTLATAVGVLLLSYALFVSGALRYQFFPPVEGDRAYASLTMPPGTPVAVTNAAITQIEQAAETLQAEVEAEAGEPVFLHRLTTLGGFQPRDGPPHGGNRPGSSNQAEVSLELSPADDRAFSTQQIVDMWRERTGPVADAVALEFVVDAFSMGKAIQIDLRGTELDKLRDAAVLVRTQLGRYAGVKDVSDSFRDGKQEVKLVLRPEARPLGISLRDLGSQVRHAFHGDEVQRIQRGRDDLRVMLRYPERERRSLGSLEDMRIRLADGTEAPFASVAEARPGHGLSTIRRIDRRRVVEVSADVDRGVTTPENIIADLERALPQLLADHPGVRFEFSGEQREHGDAVVGLIRGFGLALMLIYGLLAIPLRSWTQPLIIMSVIPFGATGAIWGHLLTGWDLVFFSLLGIVALSGVVVNGSLVLVHYVNARRAEGMPLLEAVPRAGVVRFRPIVLTAATTFVGLVPLMVIQSVQTRVMVPMAISLGFGVLFASVVTLLLVPCLYLVLEDLLTLLAKRNGLRAWLLTLLPGRRASALASDREV